MCGLGKLGLPVSVAMALNGHEVYGYDVDKKKVAQYRKGKARLYEPDINNKLRTANEENLHYCDSMSEVFDVKPEIIFVAVPTPSLSDHRFDTSYIIGAVREIVDMSEYRGWYPIISVISTVLPTTIRSEIKPLVPDHQGLFYNPYFIAMGTVIEDFLFPEFVLLGEQKRNTMLGDFIEEFYKTLINAPVLRMTWENAEIAKMCYNTIIGFKIVIANTIMELCHNIPNADCDVITDAFKHATTRITSHTYLRGGMGDGGECHPRDNRALSWLCKNLGLSTNPFDFIMASRDIQAEWLADLMQSYGLPTIIVGKRFKPNTDLITDSASTLVGGYLNWAGEANYYDPPIEEFYWTDDPAVFLIAIEESWTRELDYPKGSVVLDVWRQFTENDINRLVVRGVEYVPIGRKPLGKG
jgi:UDPglucose 6-dehydrogenase